MSSTSAIVMTGHGSIVLAVEAMKKGAVDYLTKLLAFDQLRIVIKKALDVRRLQDHRAFGQPSMTRFTVSPAGVLSASIVNAPEAFHHLLTASSETWYRDAQFASAETCMRVT
jgi:DNA-binding response OmpR family regulator